MVQQIPLNTFYLAPMTSSRQEVAVKLWPDQEVGMDQKIRTTLASLRIQRQRASDVVAIGSSSRLPTSHPASPLEAASKTQQVDNVPTMARDQSRDLIDRLRQCIALKQNNDQPNGSQAGHDYNSITAELQELARMKGDEGDSWSPAEPPETTIISGLLEEIKLPTHAVSHRIRINPSSRLAESGHNGNNQGDGYRDEMTEIDKVQRLDTLWTNPSIYKDLLHQHSNVIQLNPERRIGDPRGREHPNPSLPTHGQEAKLSRGSSRHASDLLSEEDREIYLSLLNTPKHS